jgi:dipeptidyl-peptidase-4
MHRASLLLYMSLSTGLGAVPSASAAAERGPYPGYLTLHAKTRGFTLGRPQRAIPTPDGKAVLFLRATATSPELRLHELDVQSGRVREILTPAQLLKGAEESLSPEEKARRERMRQSHRGFTTFELSRDGSLLLIPFGGKLYTVSRVSGEVTEQTPLGDNGQPLEAAGGEPAFDPQLSPDGKLVAYVRGRDLYVLDLRTRKERRLTQSQHPLVTNGLAEFIAQEELHRFTGFFWSPDSQQIAFTEVDNRPVETLYLPDALRPELPPQPLRYPRPGTDNAVVRLGIISVTGSAAGSGGGKAGAPRFVEWARDKFPYIATVVWSERSPLLVTVLSRTQKDLELYAVDDKTLQVRRLLAEHGDAWVNLDQDVPKPLKDGSGFLWTSEQSGGRELELRDASGSLMRVLVPRAEGFRKLVHLDDQNGYVTYAASPEPSEQQLFRVPLLGGAPVSLVNERGYLMASFGRAHDVYVVHAFSKEQHARTVVMRTPPGGLGASADQRVTELPSVATPPPFVPRLEITQVGPQGFRVSIVRPRHFQAGRKYPVLVDVYGGPHHQQVQAMAGRYMLEQWLADHGFIVVAADGRGTPARGTAWEQAIGGPSGGSFADIPLDDQVSALQEAGKRYPELDLSRVGIYGWSFGGYMAALAVLRRPDVFHVGVAGAPVVDWRDYDTGYTERYLGLPAENKEGYDRSSLLTYAANLRRPLLIVHGTSDDNVMFFHSMKLSHALFRAGKPHELLPLPGLTHMVPDPVVTERLWTRIASVFAGALKPEFAPR